VKETIIFETNHIKSAAMNTVRKFTFLSCILITGIVKAQTADEIINKHIDAIGGKEVIDKITSEVTNGDVKVMGTNGTVVTTLVPGKGFKSVAKVGGQEMIQCFTPTGGWNKSEINGQDETTSLTDEQVKTGQSLLQVGGALFNYKANGGKVEFAGTVSEQGVNAYKIKLTSNSGKQVSFFYIHPKTYYIIKQDLTDFVGRKEVSVTSIFTGHTKTEIGLVIPFTTTIKTNGTDMIVSIKKVEFNTPVDMKIFDMPE